MAALTYLLWLTTREGLRPETAAALVRRFGTQRRPTSPTGVRTAFVE
ncbi:MAG: hypothetical protein ACLS63_08275 [Flavonifractor plautii]